MDDNNEQLDRIEKKLDHILGHLHILGSYDNEVPPVKMVEVREGNHSLIPSAEELRKRSIARS